MSRGQSSETSGLWGTVLCWRRTGRGLTSVRGEGRNDHNNCRCTPLCHYGVLIADSFQLATVTIGPISSSSSTSSVLTSTSPASLATSTTLNSQPTQPPQPSQTAQTANHKAQDIRSQSRNRRRHRSSCSHYHPPCADILETTKP